MTDLIKTDDSIYQTAGFGRTATGIVAGGVTMRAVEKIRKPYTRKLSQKMTQLSADNSDKFLRDGIQKAIGSDGANLKKLGVEFFDLSKSEQYQTCIDKTANSLIKKGKGFLDKIVAKTRAVAYTSAYKDGTRACYRPGINAVLVNVEKRGLSAFHEIGHAINRNSSKFWSFMQRMKKPAMITAAFIPVVGLLKRKKVEGEKPKGIIDRTTTFVKNNVGKLTTLAFLPVVAEELMATARGNKLAKKFLSPELFKKVRLNNAIGASTYICVALTAGLGAWAASKVRDLITTPKKVHKN